METRAARALSVREDGGKTEETDLQESRRHGGTRSLIIAEIAEIAETSRWTPGQSARHMD